jgi:hypothetical protein
MCYRLFVIYRGNEWMPDCKVLTMYYFLAIHCTLSVCSKFYSSENLHQNVRLLNVIPLNTFSLNKQWRTAGLLRVMRFQTALRHNIPRYSSALHILKGKDQCRSSVRIFSLAQPTLHKHNKPTSLPSVSLDLAISALKRLSAVYIYFLIYLFIYTLYDYISLMFYITWMKTLITNKQFRRQD